MFNINKPNWTKLVTYLLKITNITDTPIQNSKNNHIINKFKDGIKHLYETWWTKQAKPTGVNKLDFYYKYKKTFKYETYLDNIPKYIRIYMTRLRLSSHSLPIELHRYNKKKNKREERKCPICNLDEMGDEEHYLLKCNNNEISRTRENFIIDIKREITQFEQFSNKNIINYCMLLNDQRIQMPISIYIKNILKTYKEETEGMTLIVRNTPIKTRIGRTIKKPVKLNL